MNQHVLQSITTLNLTTLHLITNKIFNFNIVNLKFSILYQLLMTNNDRLVFNLGIKFFSSFNLIILSTILFTSSRLFLFICFPGFLNKYLYRDTMFFNIIVLWGLCHRFILKHGSSIFKLCWRILEFFVTVRALDTSERFHYMWWMPVDDSSFSSWPYDDILNGLCYSLMHPLLIWSWTFYRQLQQPLYLVLV